MNEQEKHEDCKAVWDGEYLCHHPLAGDGWPSRSRLPIVVTTANGYLGIIHRHPLLFSLIFFSWLEFYLKDFLRVL